MGIVNITPDSFYEGSRMQTKTLIPMIEKMVQEGMDILDLGGQSSRPGALEVSAEEEWMRIDEPLKLILKYFPKLPISIDTYHAKVAEKALEHGAHIINDIYAGTFDLDMLKTVARFKAAMVLMHMQGNPQTMQKKPTYQNVLVDVWDFLQQRITEARKAGVFDLIIDPGFGFGKTLDDNYLLLKNMKIFSCSEVPVLAGVSRKSMICRVLNIEPSEALNGTTALHWEALNQGASVLRVHDVKEAKECVRLWLRSQPTFA